MWLWRWLRWLRGEVRFRAQGGLCERFLNQLRAQSIVLWDVETQEDGVIATCKASQYRRVRAPARRTGTRVRAVSYKGAAKRFRPFRHRVGLLVGAALGTAVYILLASRIWAVDIAVSDNMLREQVERELAACGIAVGEPIKAADVTAARMRTVAGVPEVHRIEVSFDGCIVHVAVSMQEDSIVLPDTTPANIVASHDGRILEMRVSAGQAVGKVGEGVVAGDLLVSGAVETKAGILFRHASAVVLAQTEHVFEASASKEEYIETYAQSHEQPSVMFLSWEIPLYTAVAHTDHWDVSEHERYVRLFGTQLPVGIRSRVFSKRERVRVAYTAQQVERLAKERVTAAAVLPDTAVVTGVTYTGYWEGDTYRIRAQYTCVEDIAKEVPLLTTSE